jgi:uncharacterized membrane protein YdjX (TVP38/TMEM64 family)
MSDIHEDPSARNPRSLRRWLPLALLAAAIAIAWASGIHRHLTLAAIADHRDLLKAYVAAHLITALCSYAVVYVATIALSLPGGALLTIVGGFLFGWLLGGLVTVVSATAGATIIFLIARSSFGTVLSERAGPSMKSLAEGFRRDAFHYLLFLRLVPLFPFWLVNIAPALFNVRLSTYIAATFIGIVPATFAFSILGSGLDGIIAAQRAAYEACVAAKGAGQCRFAIEAHSLVTPELLIAFAALGVVALVPVVVKRLKARRAPAGDNTAQ